MSASLVGSEMCIRDSIKPEPGALDRARSAASLAMIPNLDDRSVCAGAVSYTHLTLPTICSV
eukprot:14392017-Alexandrium_andersonii.AAC.1